MAGKPQANGDFLTKLCCCSGLALGLLLGVGTMAVGWLFFFLELMQCSPMYKRDDTLEHWMDCLQSCLGPLAIDLARHGHTVCGDFVTLLCRADRQLIER